MKWTGQGGQDKGRERWGCGVGEVALSPLVRCSQEGQDMDSKTVTLLEGAATGPQFSNQALEWRFQKHLIFQCWSPSQKLSHTIMELMPLVSFANREMK